MKIAIIGAGNVGSALGRGWAQAGHQVTFGVRDPAGKKTAEMLAEIGANASAAGLGEAAAQSDVIVLATPWGAVSDALGQLGDLTGKILFDCTNPLKGDLSGLEAVPEGSGGQHVAALAAGARVVKIFNTTGSGNMLDPKYGGERAVMPYCGDDAEAKTASAQLAADIGFEPLDAGPLARAGLLEHLAMLWISLAFQQGLGRDFAFVLHRR